MTNPTPPTIGTRIRDNDRGSDTCRTIIGFLAGDCEVLNAETATHVRATNRANTSRIRIDRIYTDGKPRKSGWSVVR